jgi:cytochrome c oxidase subunit I
MPRHVAAHLDADAGWNFASAIGAYTFALGLVFAVKTALGFRRKETAGANPWGPSAATLEWTLAPRPFHQFKTLPLIE